MKLLIADDHGLSREFIAGLLRKMYPHATILEARDRASTERQWREHRPDLVILDIIMPGMNGLAGVLELIRAFPDSRVVICSGAENPVLVETLLASGARGFISKCDTSDALRRSISLAMKDGLHISPRPQDPRTPRRLTPRQAEVLGMICAGFCNKEIARRLGIAERTVKFHVNSVLDALGVQNRTQAMAACGLPPEPATSLSDI